MGVITCAMDTDKIKIYGARVKVDSLSKVAAIEQAEKDKMVLLRRPFFAYIYLHEYASRGRVDGVDADARPRRRRRGRQRVYASRGPSARARAPPPRHD